MLRPIRKYEEDFQNVSWDGNSEKWSLLETVPLLAQHLGYARVCHMATFMLRIYTYTNFPSHVGRLLWSFLKKKYCCFYLCAVFLLTKRNKNSRCSPLCAATMLSSVHLKTLPRANHLYNTV